MLTCHLVACSPLQSVNEPCVCLWAGCRESSLSTSSCLLGQPSGRARRLFRFQRSGQSRWTQGLRSHSGQCCSDTDILMSVKCAHRQHDLLLFLEHVSPLILVITELTSEKFQVSNLHGSLSIKMSCLLKFYLKTLRLFFI